MFNPEQVNKGIVETSEEISTLQREKEEFNSTGLVKVGEIPNFENSIDELRKQREELRKQREEFELLPEELRKNLSEIDYELWNFLDKEKEAIFGIKDWEIYRRAVEAVEEKYRDIHKVSGDVIGVGIPSSEGNIVGKTINIHIDPKDVESVDKLNKILKEKGREWD